MQSLDLELWWRRQRSGSVCAENIPFQLVVSYDFFFDTNENSWKTTIFLEKATTSEQNKKNPEKQCSILKKKRRMFLRRRQPPAGSFFPSWIKISKRKLIQPCASLPALAELRWETDSRNRGVSLGLPGNRWWPRRLAKKEGNPQILNATFLGLGLGIIKRKPHFGIKVDASRW